MYLLDTNILIYLQKARSIPLLQRLKTTPVESLFVSVFTVAELVYGCSKSSDPNRNRQAMMELLLPFTILDFVQSDCDAYGSIRTHLERRGQPIGTIDTFIGAQALSRALVLVTNNVGELGRIPGLIVEDWSE